MPIEELYSHLLIHEQRLEHHSSTLNQPFPPPTLPPNNLLHSGAKAVVMVTPPIEAVGAAVVVVFLRCSPLHQVNLPVWFSKFAPNLVTRLLLVTTGSIMHINVTPLSPCKPMLLPPPCPVILIGIPILMLPITSHLTSTT